MMGVPVSIFQDRESSDDVAAGKRLTGRHLASAWGMVGLGFAGLALVSIADLDCSTDQQAHAARQTAADDGAAARPCRAITEADASMA